MDIEDAVSQILGMGFTDEKKVRHALSLARNRVPDAVELLTGGSSQLGEDDMEMDEVTIHSGESGSPRKRRGTDDNHSCGDWGEEPPRYDDFQTGSAGERRKKPARETGSSSDVEFPLTHLYELEERLNAESWSVPVRRDESLGKCLIASFTLAREGRTTEKLKML